MNEYTPQRSNDVDATCYIFSNEMTHQPIIPEDVPKVLHWFKWLNIFFLFVDSSD